MPPGAYIGEMEPSRDQDETYLQAIAGEFIRAFAVEPEPDVERDHLLAIMREVSDPSRMSTEPAPRIKTRRRALRLVAATGLGLGMLSGLAFAGALPDALQDALSDAAGKAGFSLPASEAHRNDAERRKDGAEGPGKGKSVSDDVKKVLEDDSLDGKDKGDAVSDTASQNRQNDEHANPSGVTATSTDTPPGRSKPKPNQPDKP